MNIYYIYITGLRPATLLKRKLWYRCFPVSFVKCLRTPFFQNTSGRLLLLLLRITHFKLQYVNKRHFLLSLCRIYFIPFSFV